MKLFVSKEEINELPIISFSGPIILVTSSNQCLSAVEKLQNETVLGFDTETRPAFKKGVKHEISLLQLSTKNQVFLFRLNKFLFSGPLKNMMANKAINSPRTI